MIVYSIHLYRSDSCVTGAVVFKCAIIREIFEDKRHSSATPLVDSLFPLDGVESSETSMSGTGVFHIHVLVAEQLYKNVLNTRNIFVVSLWNERSLDDVAAETLLQTLCYNLDT